MTVTSISNLDNQLLHDFWETTSDRLTQIVDSALHLLAYSIQFNRIVVAAALLLKQIVVDVDGEHQAKVLINAFFQLIVKSVRGLCQRESKRASHPEISKERIST